MLGAISGDLIGSVYEFNNTKDYNFDLIKNNSNYTDDSIMTMAVARWLLDDPGHDLNRLEEKLVGFGNDFPCPKGGYGGGFRAWLFWPESLRPFDTGSGVLPYKSTTGRHPYGSFGNGSAMRVSACGWFFDTIEETERVAALSAEITHNHPEGIKGAQATAAAIWMARNGKDKSEIKEYISNRFGYDLERTYEYLNKTYSWSSSCQGTVPEAIIVFLESTDFEDAVRKAVSIGGDSDTLACITGGIAEAYYGGVPEEIRSKVLAKLPESFRGILAETAAKTAYSKVFNASEPKAEAPHIKD